MAAEAAEKAKKEEAAALSKSMVRSHIGHSLFAHLVPILMFHVV